MKKTALITFSLVAILVGFAGARPAQAGTGVYVNGQQLNYAQWVNASRMVGYPVRPGSYWYNPATGAYGTLGRSNGGGDRFWSSGYSAGNSNADNSQGYVSVPGYGPVSYGM